jgi:hypothetical protein
LLCTRPMCLVGFFYSAGSLKQQSVDRHVAALGHIILILSQPVFALSPYFWRYNTSKLCLNRIGGVMVVVLASSVVDRGFEPQSGQTKDYNIGICCFSDKHAALRRKSKDWLLYNCHEHKCKHSLFDQTNI